MKLNSVNSPAFKGYFAFNSENDAKKAKDVMKEAEFTGDPCFIGNTLLDNVLYAPGPHDAKNKTILKQANIKYQYSDNGEFRSEKELGY